MIDGLMGELTDCERIMASCNQDETLRPSREDMQRKWDELSQNEKNELRDMFHLMCADGIGNRHPYYRLLMDQLVDNYAGD